MGTPLGQALHHLADSPDAGPGADVLGRALPATGSSMAGPATAGPVTAGPVTAGPVTAADLWALGRRRHQRRRAGAALSVLLIALLAGLGVSQTWNPRATASIPAGPSDAPLLLPDHFYSPSAFLPGTAQDGPIGPLVAVITEPDSWSILFGNHGLTGVSGRTGEYRHLDLPGYDARTSADPEGQFALSPDGRRLAYWVAGATVDNTTMVTGVTVYDTTTGTSRTTPLSSANGVVGTELLWTEDTLWIGYEVLFPPPEGPDARRIALERWDLHTGTPTPDPQVFDAWPSLRLSGRAPNGRVVSFGGNRFSILCPQGLVSTFTVNPKVSLDARSPVISLDGTRLAVLRANSSDTETDSFNFNNAALLVGPLVTGPRRLGPGSAAGTAVITRQVGGLHTAARVLGWRDNTHVVVGQQVSPPGAVGWPPLVARNVDVSTGASTALTTIEQWPTKVTVAEDAWRSQVVPTTEPQWPVDRRWYVGVLAAMLLLALSPWGYRKARRVLA